MFDMCWITLKHDEQHEREALDQHIDCLQGEAMRWFEADCWGPCLALCNEISSLQRELDGPLFDLDVIY
jgi:hypothetical protein